MLYYDIFLALIYINYYLIYNHRKKENISESNKILTSEYLDWYAKLNGLPSILTDKIQFSLYKKYKKETGYKPWQLSEVYESKVSLFINLKSESKVSYLSFFE